MMAQLRAAIFYATFAIYTILLGLLGLPVILLSRRRVAISFASAWARGALALLRWICGVRVEIRGRMPDGPAVLAVKHQSALETLALPALMPQVAFVMKKELLWLPVIGQYLWATGQIAIDRKAGAEALRRMLGRAREALGRGRTVVIFPEGTRMPPGERRPYLPGVLALAQLKAPLVPVAVNSGFYWGRLSFAKTPGTAVISFLEPLPDNLPRRELLARLETAIEDESARLAQEARTALSR